MMVRSDRADEPSSPLRTQSFLKSRAILRSCRGIVAATALLFALSWFVRPESLALGPLSGMIPFAAILAVVALGQTLVIQQGGIDLSVPGVVSLSGVIVAYY